MSLRSGSVRQRRLRTKTFTGCWTCRSRHLKCDEDKPRCTRCLDAHLECEGYGLRLSWAPIRNPSNPSQPRRQRHPPTDTDALPLPETLHRHAAEAVEDLSSPRGEASQSSGVAEPLQQGGGSTCARAIISPADQAGLLSTGTPSCQNDEFDFNISTPQLLLLESLHGLNESITSQFPSSPHPLPPPPSQGHEDAGAPHASVADQDLTGEDGSGSTQATIETCPDVLTSVTVIVTSPEDLRDTAIQRQLLEHWTMNLADSMMPIPSFDNPVLNVITPIALEGSRAVDGMASPATSVFHLICSASAFHLGRKQKSSRFLDLCLEHHELGISHLRQTVSVRDDESHLVALLAAFCMCLINETLSVGAPFWKVHMRGACNWLNQIDNAMWTSSRAASSLYQLFAGIVTVIQLQLGSDLGKPLKYPLKFHRGDGQFRLDTILGWDLATLDALLEMIAWRQGADGGPGHSQLDAAEIALYLSLPSPVEYALDNETCSIIFHHKRMFHYATIVYLRRSFRGSSLQDVRPWITKAVQHLERIVHLTHTSQRPCSPCVWPVAIVSLEADEQDLQRRVIAILDHLSDTLSFDIWLNVKGLVNSLWRERKEPHKAQLSWETFIREKHGEDLLLV